MKPVLFTLLAFSAFVYVSLCFRATVGTIPRAVSQSVQPAPPAQPAKPKLSDAEIDLIVRYHQLQREMKDFDVNKLTLEQAQAKQAEFEKRGEAIITEMKLRSL